MRIICDSLITNGGKMRSDKQIKLPPERSLTGLAVGDEIALTREQFERLSRGFFAVREDRRKVVISLVEARLARDLAPRYARQAEQLERPARTIQCE